MRLAGLVGAVCLLALTSPVGAQPASNAPALRPSPTAAATDVDDAAVAVAGVTVVAPRKATVHDFISRAGSKTSDGQLARWRDEICPQATGLPGDYDAYFETRLRAAALSVRAKVASTKCEPNVIVYFTPDPQKTLSALRKKNPWMFGGERPDILTGDIAADRPIFWTHNVIPVAADGSPGTISCRAGHCSLVLLQVTASRLQSPVVDSIGVTAIVVDTHKVKGFSFGSLSSYIAMVALGQFNADDIGSDMPTVLNLFKDKDEGRPVPADLTEWDRAYLTGLYTTDSNVSASMQRAEIYRHLRFGPGIADDPAR